MLWFVFRDVQQRGRGRRASAAGQAGWPFLRLSGAVGESGGWPCQVEGGASPPPVVFVGLPPMCRAEDW